MHMTSDLQGGGSTNQQPQTLGDQRGLRGQRQEHDEAQEVCGLGGHPVHDTAIHQWEDDLSTTVRESVRESVSQ